MSRAAAIAGGVLGSLTLAVIGWYWFLVESSATGESNLDPLRWQTAFSLFKHGAPTLDNMRAMMAIYNNENGPYNVMREGDTDLDKTPGGPSIGPGKVYRETAVELGLWTGDPDDADGYAAFGQDTANESLLIDWAVRVYLDKKKKANGQIWGNDGAVRRYNGAGPKARTYAADAAQFYSDTWGNA